MKLKPMFLGLGAAIVMSSMPTLAQAKTRLIVNCFWPPQHFVCQVVLPGWLEEVEKVTEGRVVGNIPPKSVAPPPEQLGSVEKGIVESAQKGVLAGVPTVDFKITLDDGSYHAVDSSEMAFKIAGSLAFKKAVEQASPTLLEPIMKLTVTTPEDFMGDIMGDLNGRRGKVLGMDNAGKNQVINAQVPMAEFLSYASDLRSMTGGRGMFTMEFSHYDEVPAQIVDKVIEEANKSKE